MIPIKTRTIQTIARATDETTPTTNDHNSADENKSRQPNHDGHITDSNAKKDEGIVNENLMIFKYRKSDHKGVTTGETNHPQLEESEAKQTDKKRDKNKKIQVGIKFKKPKSYKNSMRQSDDAVKATASSNYPQVQASVTKQTKKKQNKKRKKNNTPLQKFPTFAVLDYKNNQFFFSGGALGIVGILVIIFFCCKYKKK